jgi:Bifunctional DNA primase/polymerase, N-terminal/Primase C terminal 1 (PriCT-1)/AAA domain
VGARGVSGLVDAALTWAERAWRVHPCRAETKEPITPHGFKDATTDPDVIRRHQWPLIGGVPGSAGLVVLDVDAKHGATLADVPADGLETRRHRTPSGGWHLLYRARPAAHYGNGERTDLNGGKVGFDIRHLDGYIILPPSPGYTLDLDVEPIDAPAWLELPAAGDGKPVAAPVGDVIPSGQRDQTLTSLAGTMRRRGMGHAEIQAALTVANTTRCQPPLPAADVERIVRSVSRYEPSAPTVGGKAQEPRLRLTPLSGVKRRSSEMLLPGLLAPVGTVGVLAGQQGIGKGTILMRWAADLSRLGHGVVFITEEDSAEAVVKPRAEAAGADLSRIFTVQGTRPEEFGGIMLPRDTDELRQKALDVEARLVIIDPWTNHVQALDIDKGAVRHALMPLRYLAESAGLCVVLSAHPIKNAGMGHPMDEIAHASALTQVARWAYWVTLDPEHGANPKENPHRLVAHVKANLTRYGDTLKYRIGEVLLPAENGEPEVTTVAATAEGTSMLDYTGIRRLEKSINHEPNPDTEIAKCADWLRTYLADGHQESGAVKHAGMAAGFRERTIKRACEYAGVTTRRGKPGTPSTWSLSTAAKTQTPIAPVLGHSVPRRGNLGPTGPTGPTVEVSHINDIPARAESPSGQWASAQVELGPTGPHSRLVTALEQLDRDGLKTLTIDGLEKSDLHAVWSRRAETLQPNDPHLAVMVARYETWAAS